MENKVDSKVEKSVTFKGKSFKENMGWMLRDIFTGWSKWEMVYAFILLSLQVAVLFIPVNGSELQPLWIKVVSFITGMSGTICVLLVAKGKISNYLFGIVQTVFGVLVGGFHRLIGETFENLMYLVFQFIGIKEWSKHMVVESDSGEEQDTGVVETKKFHWLDWVITVALIAGLTYGLGTMFYSLNGSFGYSDAFTLVVAVIAQLLMTYRYREQWVIWFSLNVVSVWQFYSAGNASMFALYVALTINTIFGWFTWSKSVSKTRKDLPIIQQITLKLKNN